MAETIKAADGSERSVVEVAMNECRAISDSDNPVIRFVNDADSGFNISVDPCSLLKIDADEVVAEELGVDVDTICDILTHRLDGRKVGQHRVGSVEVHPEHGVVVDANIHADTKQNDTREELEADIVSAAN